MKDFVSSGVSGVGALVGSFALLGVACVMALPDGGPGLALGGAVFSLLGAFWMGSGASRSLAHLLGEAHGAPMLAVAVSRRAGPPNYRGGTSPGGGLR